MLTPGQKMEHLLGCSLDDAYVIAHWDTNLADVHQLSAKVRLIEIMTKHGFRFALEALRDTGRERVVAQMAKALLERDQADEAAAERAAADERLDRTRE